MKTRNRIVRENAERDYFEQLKNVMQTSYILCFLASCDFIEANEETAMKLAKKISEWQEIFNNWRVDGVLDYKVESELNSLGLSLSDFNVEFTYDDLKKECKDTAKPKLTSEDIALAREHLKKLSNV